MVDDGSEIELVQDRISISGANTASLGGGDGADQMRVAFSKEITVFVDGGDPESAPGDELLLDTDGFTYADDGKKLTAIGYQDIHYIGMEAIGESRSDTEAPTVEIMDVTSRGAVGEITIRFSEPVTGLDLKDVSLRRDNQKLDLASATLQQHADEISWTIGNLANTTNKAGLYKMELTANDSAIEDLFGNDLLEGDTMEWLHEPGDSNGDGRFDSSDLIAAFVAGKYDKNVPATYAEGDWNGDGVFDSIDLIFAFANGDYVR